MDGRERGQAAVSLLVVVVAVFVSVSAAAVAVGGDMLDRRRAQTAADAAALAALVEGRAGAERLARRHGATLVSFVDEPARDRVSVIVRIGAASATAAATDTP